MPKKPLSSVEVKYLRAYNPLTKKDRVQNKSYYIYVFI